MPVFNVWREVLREEILNKEILYKRSVMCGGVKIFFFLSEV